MVHFFTFLTVHIFPLNRKEDVLFLYYEFKIAFIYCLKFYKITKIYYIKINHQMKQLIEQKIMMETKNYYYYFHLDNASLRKDKW